MCMCILFYCHYVIYLNYPSISIVTMFSFNKKFRGFFKIFKKKFDGGKSINLPWGHMRSHKNWARSVQSFWRLLDTNGQKDKRTPRQAKYIYMYGRCTVWVFFDFVYVFVVCVFVVLVSLFVVCVFCLWGGVCCENICVCCVGVSVFVVYVLVCLLCVCVCMCLWYNYLCILCMCICVCCGCVSVFVVCVTLFVVCVSVYCGMCLSMLCMCVCVFVCMCVCVCGVCVSVFVVYECLCLWCMCVCVCCVCVSVFVLCVWVLKMVYSLVGFELLECNSVGAGIHQSINPSSHVTLTNYYKTGFMFFKQLHTS